MTKKLKQYNSSKLMEISITHKGEKFSFNLFEELKIRNEILMNGDLKTQSSYYGFLMLLHKKLLTTFEELKAERKRIYGVLFFKAKGRVLNNRPLSDDLSKAWVEKNPKYLKATLNCIKAKDQADTILSCVRAFEQRKDLLQTLSSNVRKEKINS